MKRVLLLASVFAILAAPREAWAYCTNAIGSADDCGALQMPNWAGRQSIPIYFDLGLHTQIRHQDGSSWTYEELQDELLWVIEMFNASGADLPHMYLAGPTPSCGPAAMASCAVHPCQIAGSIRVTWFVGPIGLAIAYTSVTTPASGQYIAVNASHRYEHWGASPTFAGVMVHELTHALGFSHYWDCHAGCLTWPCSVVDPTNNAGQAHTLYQTDVDGLLAVYGVRDPDPVDDQCVYGDAPDEYVSFNSLALHGLAPAASSGPGDLTGVVYRTLGLRRPELGSWDVFGDWMDWTHPETEVAHGRMGAAVDRDTGTVYTAYQIFEDVNNIEKAIRVTSHADPAVGSVEFTMATPRWRRHGVSATFEPTAGGLLLVWRADNGEIRLRLPDGTVHSVVDGGGQAVVAFDTPSMACEPTGTTFFPCLLVWADPAAMNTPRRFHYLRWMHFYVDASFTPDRVDVGPIITAPITVNTAPQVAFRESEETGELEFFISWVKAAPGGQRTVWLYRKQVAHDAPWDWSRRTSHGVFTDSPQVALGSTFLCGWLFIWI